MTITAEKEIARLRGEVAGLAARLLNIRDEEQRWRDVENGQLRRQLEAERGWREKVTGDIAGFVARSMPSKILILPCPKCGHQPKSTVAPLTPGDHASIVSDHKGDPRT